MPLAEQALDSTHAVRIGAITIPAHPEANRHLATAETTGEDVRRIVASGQADLLRAEHLEQVEVPRAHARYADKTDKREQAAERVREAEARLSSERPLGAHAGRPRRELLSRVALPARLAVALMFADLLTATLATVPSVSSLVVTTFPGESDLIAAGISLALISASAVAGVMRAAIRIPGRWLAR